MREKRGLIKNEQQFISHLNNIVEITKENQTDVVIVGGIALRSAMNKPVEFIRQNGTVPDIDMIALGPNYRSIRNSIEDINKYQKFLPSCPPVSLEPVDFSDKPRINYSPLEMVSGLRKDSNGRYFLTFRSVEQEIDHSTMLPIVRQYGDINIPTLPKETIYYRYLIRCGFLKPKDENKIKEFCEYLNNTSSDVKDPTLYFSYLDFCERINEKHKWVINLTKNYWKFDQKIGGKISGSNGPVYGLIKAFRR